MAGSVQVAEGIGAAVIAAGSPALAAATETLAIAPSLILALAGVAVLGLDLALDRPGHAAKPATGIGGGFESDPLLFTSLLGLAGAAAFLAAATAGADGPLRFRGALVADGLSAGAGLLILLLIAALLLTVTGRGGGVPADQPRRRGEFFCAALFGGALTLLCVQSVGLGSAFLGLEGLCLVVFVIAALENRDAPSRAGLLRMFIAGESASAAFLLGLVLVYGATGAESFASLADAGPKTSHDAPLLAAGTSLIAAALMAKGLAVPFAAATSRPAPEAASLVILQWNRIVQIATAVLALRIGLSLTEALDATLAAILLSVGAAALLAAGALCVARHRGRAPLLRTTTTCHLGFLLMAVAVELAATRGEAVGLPTGAAFLFYLLVFEVPWLGAVTWSALGAPRDSITRIGFAILVLSLAGVPPLPGFWGRLVLLREAIATGFTYPALIAAATWVASLHDHLSLAAVTLEGAREEDNGPPGTGTVRDSRAPLPDAEHVPRLLVTLIAVASLLVGLFPEPLLALCRAWALG